jgi:D-alanine--poly(phosphoribitol) ligase subunit 1
MKILDAIDRWARTEPGRIAHESGEWRMSYGELASRSDAVAAHLRRHGGPRQTPVVITGHREPEMLQGFIGCLKAGHPYVPVDILYPEKRIAAIYSQLKDHVVLTPEIIAQIQGDGETGKPVTEDEIAYIIFTSGSTGEPKGVPIRSRSLDLFVDWILSEHTLHNEVFLNQAPFCFDLSVMDLYPCLVSGGRLVSITREIMGDLGRLFPVLESSELTSWVSTPSFARLCVAESRFGQERLPAVRRFLFCGETLSPALAQELMNRFPKAEIWNTYGPTEATVATTSVRLTNTLLENYATVPVGHPMAGSHVSIRDESLQGVAAGEKGEIVISGPHVSPGYLVRPGKESPFLHIDGEWSYRTGDWGRIVDGLVFFEGRMDNQIKLNGYRIELGDMEANLRALAGVHDAVVLPIWESGAVTSVTAFLIPGEVLSSTQTEFILSLRRALRKRVPDYLIPGRFVLKDSFPVTMNGKVDRAKLAQSLS